MVCTIEVIEKPKLKNPVLIEGLPGIGFVANITALHLINELKAKTFAKVRSSSFQDLAVTTETGGTRSPTSELYYAHSKTADRDLVIWYGNTQSLTTAGQYELCNHILDLAQELGCKLIITVGGYKQDEARTPPQTYTAATDSGTASDIVKLGAKIMVGQIFGVAGLLIGLARIRKTRGFSLLVETPGSYPDENAARVALSMLNRHLELNVDLTRLSAATEETKKILESFGLVHTAREEKKKEEDKLRWYV